MIEKSTDRNNGSHRDFVRSLERGLSVIRAFGPEHPHLSLVEVSTITGLTRAAARRFLMTLVELGYVDFDGKAYSLRPSILELGYAYLSTLGLNDVAAPHLEKLVSHTNESSSVAVLDGDDIIYVVRVPTRRIMTVSIAVGTRFPAYATSMGRVLLAALPQDKLDEYLKRVRLDPLTKKTITSPILLQKALTTVAKQGYAIVDQELEDGLRSVAVPIINSHGRVTAATNISVHASRTSITRLRTVLLPLLLKTAASISEDLNDIRYAPPDLSC